MEGVEPVLPEPAVLTQPLVDLDERFRAECVNPALRVLVCTSSSPASRSTRRCRDTPGRAIGRAAASSPALAGWSRRISRTLRLVSSASACNTASMSANVPILLRSSKVTFIRKQSQIPEVQK
jgi:hypothetical protein